LSDEAAIWRKHRGFSSKTKGLVQYQPYRQSGTRKRLKNAIWCYGDAEAGAAAKALSIRSFKQVWTHEGREIDFFDESEGGKSV
jgi:hypothetical protein